MARVELPIKNTYVPSWGLAEGLREVLQNAKDAEDQYGWTMGVRHRGTTLHVVNDGADLGMEALLLGETTKADRADLRGRFGEGLNLALLALARSGYPVTVETKYEIWRPAIEQSETYGDRSVLVVNTRQRRKTGTGVRVTIEEIDKDEWEALKERYLFLAPPKTDEIVKTRSGSVLLGERYKGQVYVKGIWVQRAKTEYGYDLREVELDRDRKIIEHYSLQYATGDILRIAMRTDPAAFASVVVDLLESDAEDTKNFSTWDTEVTQLVAAEFVHRHGADAVPVESLGDSREAEHLGRKSVIVPKSLHRLLGTQLDTIDTVRDDLRTQVTRTYTWSDLTDTERANLEQAEWLVREGLASDTDVLRLIEVVDFRDQNLQGLWHSDRRIQISRGVLQDAATTVQVLIHELAHELGSDGEKGHVQGIESLWASVLRSLLH